MEPTLFDDLEGQAALVTGANRGIGREIATGLLDHGATVFAGRRDPEADVPTDATPVEIDVTDEVSVRDAVETVVDDAGQLDVLVNNAGVGGVDAPLSEIPTDDLDRILDVNLRGAALVAKHALPHLLEAEPGRVVNMSSGLAKLAEPIEGHHAIYRASKAGVNALTVSLDESHADEGLIANSADPGWVATDLGGEEAPRSPAEGAATPIWLARFDEGSPSGAFWKDQEQITY